MLTPAGCLTLKFAFVSCFLRRHRHKTLKNILINPTLLPICTVGTTVTMRKYCSGVSTARFDSSFKHLLLSNICEFYFPNILFLQLNFSLQFPCTHLYTGFWWGDLMERDHLEHPGIDGRIILICIFNKWDGGIDWIDLAQDGAR